MLIVPLSAVPSGDLWLHFEFTLNSGTRNNATDGTLLHFETPAGVDLGGIRTIDGYWGAYAKGDSTVNGAATTTPSYGTRQTLDICLSFAGGNIKVDFYLAGALYSTATAANSGGKTLAPRILCDNIAVVYGKDQFCTYSEVIATDGESTIGWRLCELKPASAGALSAWTGGYAELGDTDKSTAAISATAAQRVSFGLSTYAGPSSPAGFRGVFMKSQAKRGASGPSKLNAFCRIGGTNYDATAKDLDNIHQTLHEFANNPATSAPWTTAAFSSLEAGLLSAT